MENSQIIKKGKGVKPPYFYYVTSIIVVTIILVMLRVVFYFFDDAFFAYNRDIDFETLYILMDNGLMDYYKESSIGGFRAYYLYFWYFLFFPIYLFPFEIGVYIWDAFRLISAIYIAKNVDKITDNGTDKVIFLIMNGIGYFADAYLNNTNWLLNLLLFLSYIELKKDRKWLAGILFALATYKIVVILFPFVLLVVKKIKMKELIYYLIPSGILLLPYVIFPEYFWQMCYNWTYIEVEIASNMSLLLKIYLFSWQAFQTAQLMFFSLLILIFLENIKNPQWRHRYRMLIIVILTFLNLTFPIVLWPILYG